MSQLCSFLAVNLEPVSYMDEIDEEGEYEEIQEEEYENGFPDTFHTLSTNGDGRKITLPQPNGEISKPLKLDIGQVRFFFFKESFKKKKIVLDLSFSKR